MISNTQQQERTGIALSKPEERDPVFLEIDEVETVLRVAEVHSEDMRLVYALGIYAGLRKNEIMHARWE